MNNFSRAGMEVAAPVARRADAGPHLVWKSWAGLHYNYQVVPPRAPAPATYTANRLADVGLLPRHQHSTPSNSTFYCFPGFILSSHMNQGEGKNVCDNWPKRLLKRMKGPKTGMQQTKPPVAPCLISDITLLIARIMLNIEQFYGPKIFSST